MYNIVTVRKNVIFGVATHGSSAVTVLWRRPGGERENEGPREHRR